MKKALFSSLLAAGAAMFFLAPFASSNENTSLITVEKEEQKPEVISLLGANLYATPAQGEELGKLTKTLEEAKKAFEADPQNLEKLTLYGQSLASLWRYHEAIDVYSKGIERHPEHAALYRHRGHRYISVRMFDKAADDLARAAELNNRDFDIWYHLGLAHYLRGEFEKALPAYRNCFQVAEDDDAKVAVSNWLFAALRRLGEKEEAGKVLERITGDMKIEENSSYYHLLLFFKNLKSEAEITGLAQTSDLDRATVGYGLGCWYLYSGNEEKAREHFEKVVEIPYWPAFGFIASEAELFRMKSARN